MNLNIKIGIIAIALAILCSCNSNNKSSKSQDKKETLVVMKTSKGDITIKLYNKTPKHRDNLIQIIEDGVLDSVLFHRVIESFMIQGGDPDSKNAAPGQRLGNGGLNYRIDAEFHPDLFHKKGVLAAARDGNLARASSSTQFYIVQGKIFNDSTLAVAENRINDWLAQHYVKNLPENRALADSLQKAMDSENMERYVFYNDSIVSMAKNFTDFERYIIPAEHREIYKTLGGTPHLDQNYSVFGEVTKGLEIIDSIASVQTDSFDRPIEDIRILEIKVLE